MKMLVFINANLTGFFSQWSADNIDHNLCTTDGKGTLCGIGLMLSTNQEVLFLASHPFGWWSNERKWIGRCC